jgi:hypothetical protein
LHNFKNNNYQSVSECFPQIIWRETKEVEFGLAQGNRGELILVANYLPNGNISKSFETNVLSPMN